MPLTEAVPSVTFGDISPHCGESPNERDDHVSEVKQAVARSLSCVAERSTESGDIPRHGALRRFQAIGNRQ